MSNCSENLETVDVSARKRIYSQRIEMMTIWILLVVCILVTEYAHSANLPNSTHLNML